MPYKNKEDYNEAYRRWWNKNYKPGMKFYEVKKARIKAKEFYKNRQKCSIENCNELGQRHHHDYSRPLDIVWLCNYHHRLLHIGTGIHRKGIIGKEKICGRCNKKMYAVTAFICRTCRITICKQRKELIKSLGYGKP